MILFLFFSFELFFFFFFFFQAEDGIRDLYVTGVQTCALPISVSTLPNSAGLRAIAPSSPDASLKYITRAGHSLAITAWWSSSRRRTSQSAWVTRPLAMMVATIGRASGRARAWRWSTARPAQAT